MIRASRQNSFSVQVIYSLLQIVYVIVAVAGFIAGIKHVHDCTLQPMVAVYLIGAGLVHLLMTASGCCCGDTEPNTIGDICRFFVFLLRITWVVCGSVWVYPTFAKVIHRQGLICLEGSSTECGQIDCDRNVAIMACVFVTIDWVTLLFTLFSSDMCYIHANEST